MKCGIVNETHFFKVVNMDEHAYAHRKLPPVKKNVTSNDSIRVQMVRKCIFNKYPKLYTDT